MAVETSVESLMREIEFRYGEDWKNVTRETLQEMGETHVAALIGMINGVNQHLGGPQFNPEKIWQALVGNESQEPISTIEGLLEEMNALNLGQYTTADLLERTTGELAAIMDRISATKKVEFDRTTIFSSLSSLRAKPRLQFDQDSMDTNSRTT